MKKNEGSFLKPASCNKLLTSSAAFYYLGTKYQFNTKIGHNGKLEGGILEGDLVITASGDPSISNRFYKDKSDICIALREWAKVLKKKGIKTITGNIIGDDDFFNDEYYNPGWKPSSRGEWYAAEVGALCFNDNCVDMKIRGNEKAGMVAKITLKPNTSYVNVINQIQTTQSENGGIYFEREDKTNDIYVNGSIIKNGSTTEYASVHNSTLYTCTVFKEVLEEEGIMVKGKALDIDEISDEKSVRENLVTLYVNKSVDMANIVKIINRNSQNLYAEQVLKTIGKEVKGEGSFNAGISAVKDFLKKSGVYRNKWTMVDGSGLSAGNRVSPQMLVELLEYMRGRKDWPAFKGSLAQPGKKGSLRTRINQTEEDKKLGKYIYAKTGTINGVLTITGIISSKEHDDILFSIMLNDYECSVTEGRNLLDSLAKEIVKYHLTTK